MNKKGQFLGLIFGLIVFIILWAMFFGKWISDWGAAAIETNSLQGLSAFFMGNMNLWIFAGVIIGVVSVLYFGGNN